MRRSEMAAWPAIAALACGGVLLVLPAVTRAQGPCPCPVGEQRPGEPGQTELLARAKQLFREGVALLDAGELERALAQFMRSRQAHPSLPNTKSAAYCLMQLGRLDEAIELYEELLTRFGNELGEGRRELALRLQELRRRLGSIDVAANVNGALVVDGRLRATLPLLGPLRLMPGRHVVRIIMEGYETFEQAVQVRAGETVPLDARLSPLRQAGRLVVQAAGSEGAELFVDGAPLGSLPWEGTLPVGDHAVVVRQGDRGTAPSAVHVLEGKTVRLRPVLQPLGPEMRAIVVPPTARLAIDAVPVGAGGWQGRLPLGQHTLAAHEDGYLPASVRAAVGPEQPRALTLRLVADESHPRWQSSVPGTVWISASFGSAVGASLRSEAEASCEVAACSLVRGALGAARVAYGFPNGLSLELGGGYLHAARDVLRAIEQPFGPPRHETATRYVVRDSIAVDGPFGSVGVGYHHDIGMAGRLALGARFHLGGMAATGRDAIDVAAYGPDGSFAPATLAAAGTPARAFSLLLLPAVEARLRLHAFHSALGLTAVASVLDGPDNEHGELIVHRGDAKCDGYPAPVGCAPGEGFLAAEKAFGRFVLLVPTFTVGLQF
ncbi:MAG: PEGA domain-containing protein [Deltaproteobacteria bacterium]|nr:PEGA domain-containing protein [Deltaproteobacteria bacterium]